MYANIVPGNVRSSWRQLNRYNHLGLIVQFAPIFRSAKRFGFIGLSCQNFDARGHTKAGARTPSSFRGGDS
jgi:hypothetical protein